MSPALAKVGLMHLHCAVCFGFYAVSTVFQLFNCNGSQINVSGTILQPVCTKPFPKRLIFRLAQFERLCRRQNKCDLDIKILYREEKKTLWEKEKMLFTSIFFFSHYVFQSLLSQVRQKSGLCGKEFISKLLVTLIF